VDKILEILKNLHPEHDYSNSDDFIKESLIDSLDVVILVDRLEKEFGVFIDGADVVPENFKNLNTIRNFILRLKDGKSL